VETFSLGVKGAPFVEFMTQAQWLTFLLKFVEHIAPLLTLLFADYPGFLKLAEAPGHFTDLPNLKRAIVECLLGVYFALMRLGLVLHGTLPLLTTPDEDHASQNKGAPSTKQSAA
jgi:hypothetical protein